jgi:hypothetical protein
MSINSLRINRMDIHREAGTMWRQGGGADFREMAILNWYILRDVCKTLGVELRRIMFSIYWMIGVWGGSPPGDCAILEARWLHFLRFLKQIRKRIALTILTIRYFAKAILEIERAHLPPLPLLVKGNGGGRPSCPPSSGVPGHSMCIWLVSKCVTFVIRWQGATTYTVAFETSA